MSEETRDLASDDGRYRARTKSFTRRGRALRPGAQRTWDKHAQRYLIDVERDGGYTTVAAGYRLDVEAAFGRSAPLIIEVGSGNGEQIVAFAAEHPDCNLLAFEVWPQGLAKTVRRAVDAGVENIRLIEADAAQAMARILPPACAKEVWTFFPDPWRKARHHKRRLINARFARDVATVLVDGGMWRIATDWPDYAEQVDEVLAESDEFENPYSPAPTLALAPRFALRVQTRFEQRAAADGRASRDFLAVRLPRPPQP